MRMRPAWSTYSVPGQSGIVLRDKDKNKQMRITFITAFFFFCYCVISDTEVPAMESSLHFGYRNI